jgi:hypothetical protein
MKVTHYLLDPARIPVDFQADPDGIADYDALLCAAGFADDASGGASPSVGALERDWFGHPEGAAVVTHPLRSILAIVETGETMTLCQVA